MSDLKCDVCGTPAPIGLDEVRDAVSKLSRRAAGRVRCPVCVRKHGALTGARVESSDGHTVTVIETEGGKPS